MSSLDWQSNIKGELGNKKIKDMKKMLDFSKSTLEERKQIVDKILEEYDEFLKIYFFEKNEHSRKAYFSGGSLSSSQTVSEKNIVCDSIAALASYLLNSRDIERLYKDQEYVFYTDEEEFNKYHQKVVSSTSDATDEVIHFLLQQGKNYNLVGTTQITKQDLADTGEMGEILRAYQAFKEELRLRLLDIRNSTHNSKLNVPLFQAKRLMNVINDDMRYTKESYSKRVYFGGLKSEIPKIDWDMIDMTNEEHVKALLYINRGNQLSPDDDLSLIVYELNKTLKILVDNGKLKKEDLKLINLLRQEKSYSKGEISKIMGYSQSVLSKRINKISKQICKYYLNNIKIK